MCLFYHFTSTATYIIISLHLYLFQMGMKSHAHNTICKTFETLFRQNIDRCSKSSRFINDSLHIFFFVGFTYIQINCVNLG